MKRLLLTFALLASSASAQPLTTDGNWWVAQPQHDQLTYLLGFTDGLGVGYEDSSDALAVSAVSIPKCDEKTCNQLIAMNRQDDSEIEKRHQRLREITIGQILDGLNKIFSDYRNRIIRVSIAEGVVIEAIRGSTDAEIEQRLEYFRKHPN